MGFTPVALWLCPLTPEQAAGRFHGKWVMKSGLLQPASLRPIPGLTSDDMS